jgi:hypothetical protein
VDGGLLQTLFDGRVQVDLRTVLPVMLIILKLVAIVLIVPSNEAFPLHILILVVLAQGIVVAARHVLV